MGDGFFCLVARFNLHLLPADTSALGKRLIDCARLGGRSVGNNRPVFFFDCAIAKLRHRLGGGLRSLGKEDDSSRAFV